MLYLSGGPNAHDCIPADVHICPCCIFHDCIQMHRILPHVSPLLRALHWLPIQAHIEYKQSTLCCFFFSDATPVYLSDLLRVYSPSRQFCSPSDSRTLRIPHLKTKTFGHRSFSYTTPSVWNSLPFEIRHIQPTTAFKTALKTHLFKSYPC